MSHPIQHNSLVWFREDLRTEDNMALHHATESTFNHVVAVYFITPKQWGKHDVGDARRAFTLAHVEKLQAQMAEQGIELLVETVECYKGIDSVLMGLVDAHNITDVFFNYEYPINEMKRDERIANVLKQNGVGVHAYHDRIIHPTGSLRTQSGDYYKVFTPFKRAWARQLTDAHLKSYPVHSRKPITPKSAFNAETSLKKMGIDMNAVLVGASHPNHSQFNQPLARMEQFVNERATQYQGQRDFPALDGTSRLSADLACGTMSIRACVRFALANNEGQVLEGDAGIACWLSELVWRDFYQHILIGFPRVCFHHPFQADTDYVQWRCGEKAAQDLKAWQAGQTGVPIVDAAMRQLNQTGWMHNRLRMVVAMFLTKNLLIDWREGERYFMNKLVDADFGANNGGWQWAASTGTDAAPYFRVFNPISQSQKFDKDGDFIRQYVPEIAHLDNKQIHEPYAKADMLSQSLDYPAPIVDVKASRARAIQAFKDAKAIVANKTS